MKVVAILQARMGSTRLPGKVMKSILGKQVILWDLDRVSVSKFIDDIVVAIPHGKENEVIVDTIKKHNEKVVIVRGSEDDVLDRYYQAAVQVKADVIVRITSDCPLIDPQIIDLVIECFLNNSCDYCSNILERTYPRGLDAEVFSFEALEKAWKEAEKEYEREHVTPYMMESEGFKRINVSNDINLSSYRWTLDTRADFELIETIYEKVYPSKHMFFMEDILELFAEEPRLMDINKDIIQKHIY